MSHDDDYVDYGTPEPGTRTRFAEGDNDGRYDTRRGGRVSPSRAMVTVVGVVVLLIAAIAFANRGGNTEDDPESPANPDTKAQPTSPTGDTPVKTPTNGGIPTGFPQSAEGAQSAAANYTVPLAGAGMFDEDERADIVRALYVPGVAEARLSALDEVYDDPAFLQRIGLEDDGTAPTGTTFVSRINPVGASVKAYTDDTAKIAVWYSALFGLAGEDSENPVTESWYTTTYELQWADGGWKVSDYTQKDGPVPVGRDQTASSAEDMAKAIEEFGGFTYAR